MDDRGSRPAEITALLRASAEGDAGSADQLLDLVYGELRVIARALMRDHAHRSTLQPTALVHEAWLKLSGGLDSYESRKHFFVIAAKAMRQVLSDHAKAARRQKRGGAVARVTLVDHHESQRESSFDLIAFHDSLERLATLNERHARIIELRVLGMLTIDETSQVLGVSASTVKSDWIMARTWLQRELTEDGHGR